MALLDQTQWADLGIRVTAAGQPSGAQQLIAELYADLSDARNALAGIADPTQVSALNAQIADLTNKLAAANAQLTTDQQTLAAQAASDASQIKALTDQVTSLTAERDALAADKVTLTQSLEAATQQVNTLVAQNGQVQAQLTADDQTIVNLNTQIAALQLKIQQLSVNHPPVWVTVPQITFVSGVPSQVDLSVFVSDPDNDPLSLSQTQGVWPPGVMLVGTLLKFDGRVLTAPVLSTGNVITANDGKTP